MLILSTLGSFCVVVKWLMYEHVSLAENDGIPQDLSFKLKLRPFATKEQSRIPEIFQDCGSINKLPLKVVSLLLSLSLIHVAASQKNTYIFKLCESSTQAFPALPHFHINGLELSALIR